MVYGAHHEDSEAMSNTATIHHPDDVRPVNQSDTSDTTKNTPWMAGRDRIIGQFADCDDSPREVDLLSEEHIEDLLDAVDCLRGRVDQLQIHCEKLSFEKGDVEERLIEQERSGQARMEQYEQEISELRKLNTKLAAKQKHNMQGGNTSVPSWAKTALDAEKAIEEKKQAEDKEKELQITIMEKDKLISSLEWQLLDMESTVSSLQAERDRLAVELDCLLAHEQDELEAYGAVGDDKVVFSDDEDDFYQQSSYRHKEVRRHVSDLSSRDASKMDDLSALVKQNSRGATVSDLDMSSALGGGLGGLKRSTNYSNINDLDEAADIHVGGCPRFVDSVISDLSASFPVPKKPLVSSSWQSFGSDSESDWRTSPKGKKTEIRVGSEGAWGTDEQDDSTLQLSTDAEAFEDAVDADWGLDGVPPDEGGVPPEEGGVPHDEGGVLPDEGGVLPDEGGVLPDDDGVLPDDDGVLPDDGGLSSTKNGSCRSSSSAYFSGDSANEISHDLWSFTPDSIIDVSTGEELRSPAPSSKTSQNNLYNFEESENISVPLENDNNKETPNNHTADVIITTLPDMTSSESLTSSTHSMTSSNGITSRDSTSLTNMTSSTDMTSSTNMTSSTDMTSSTHVTSQERVTSQECVTSHEFMTSQECVTAVNLERTISVRSDSVVETMPKELVNHQRMNSAPIMQHGTKKSNAETANVKLSEYQKWKLSGRLGQPPGKLKVSQC